MFFYFTFALVAILLGCNALLLIPIFIILCLVHLITDGEIFYKIGHPRVLEFIAGLIISRIYRRSIPFFATIGFCVIGVMFALLSVIPTVNWETVTILWGLTGFSLVLGLVTLEVQNGAILPSFRLLGDASYAIYLFHMPIQFLLFPHFFWRWKLNQYIEPHIGLILLIGFATVVGIGIHLLIEKRLNQYILHKLLNKCLNH